MTYNVFGAWDVKPCSTQLQLAVLAKITYAASDWWEYTTQWLTNSVYAFVRRAVWGWSNPTAGGYQSSRCPV